MKVKNRTVVSVWVDEPQDHVAHGELQLAATAQPQERASFCILLAWEEIKNQNSRYGFC